MLDLVQDVSNMVLLIHVSIQLERNVKRVLSVVLIREDKRQVNNSTVSKQKKKKKAHFFMSCRG